MEKIQIDWHFNPLTMSMYDAANYIKQLQLLVDTLIANGNEETSKIVKHYIEYIQADIETCKTKVRD